jgi:hypothetical protein
MLSEIIMQNTGDGCRSVVIVGMTRMARQRLGCKQ